MIHKTDLSLVHYRWEEPSDTTDARVGQPSRRFFDPYNGNQVLFLLNYFASMHPQTRLDQTRQLESLLSYAVPEDLKSEKSVYGWMAQTFADWENNG